MVARGKIILARCGIFPWQALHKPGQGRNGRQEIKDRPNCTVYVK
ncbi:hypothetical protein BACDOR_04686 [Phocaeicola dorei DSM 17855]|uniref:Uncharacterized protein n=1 Tax=Phocaeicola dorei DSM 17855 TaxID=483217 RepID=B6W535_9BACT|nr:hypothetical protein BACDOR_04686 [Phocaeicola dorei DSM 17855]